MNLFIYNGVFKSEIVEITLIRRTLERKGIYSMLFREEVSVSLKNV